MTALTKRDGLMQWLWPSACLLILAGYTGPWLPHEAAGLVVTGLDLGEYVKFLPSVNDGSVKVWREGFYLPLVTVSATCGLLAYRDSYHYPLLIRFTFLLVGVVAALNMLPPAWTPTLLLRDEFQLQSIAIGFCLLLNLISPLLRLLPAISVYLTLAVLAVASLIFSIIGYIRIQPNIEYLYGHPVSFGWGMYSFIFGVGLLLVGLWLGLKKES